MKKKNNKHGFTLAELLIVVAIIAVLTAIAIPVFSAQLEKAREATDLANIRSAYAEVSSAGLLGEEANYEKTVALKQQQSGWQTSGDKFIGEVNINSLEVVKDGSVKVTYVPEEGENAAHVTVTMGSGTTTGGTTTEG